MLFAIIAQDKPNGVDHRMAVRPTHLEHLKTLGNKLVFAGPFLDDAEKPSGSLLVIEAASHEVKRWNWGINNPDKRGQ